MSKHLGTVGKERLNKQFLPENDTNWYLHQMLDGKK